MILLNFTAGIKFPHTCKIISKFETRKKNLCIHNKYKIRINRNQETQEKVKKFYNSKQLLSRKKLKKSDPVFIQITILYQNGYFLITFPPNHLILINVDIWKVKLTPLNCPKVMVGHASKCWHSVLGAGVPYNRKRNKTSKFQF